MNVKTIKEQFEEELVLFKKNVQLMVQDMFNQAGEVEPMLFALIIPEDQNKLTIAVLRGIEPLFMNAEGKQAAAAIMRKFNQEMKPVATAFVCEGWAKMVDKDAVTPYVNSEGQLVDPLMERPAEAKDKKEVLMFMFETFDREASVHYEIKRNEADPADVKLEKIMDREWASKKEGFVGGIMADLLTDNYDHFAQQMQRINNKENLN